MYIKTYRPMAFGKSVFYVGHNVGVRGHWTRRELSQVKGQMKHSSCIGHMIVYMLHSVSMCYLSELLLGVLYVQVCVHLSELLLGVLHTQACCVISFMHDSYVCIYVCMQVFMYVSMYL